MKLNIKKISGVLVLLCFFFSALVVFGQELVIDDAEKYAETITEQDLKSLLSIYASDEFMGRETGSEGEAKATDFIKTFYTQRGIPSLKASGNYFQNFPLTVSYLPEGHVIIGEQQFQLGKDAICLGNGDFSEIENKILFAGYGVEVEGYSDYKNLNVKGKIVALIGEGEPKDENGNYIVSKSDKSSEWSFFQTKVKLAEEKGAAAIIICTSEYSRVETYTQYFKNGLFSLESKKRTPLIFIDSNNDESFCKNLKEDRLPRIINTKVEITYTAEQKTLNGNNVVAYIKGNKYPNEYVFVSAHLDHLGMKSKRVVFNGADDDGSGTVTLLEIAEAFKKASDKGHKPDRSVVFLHVTGEEKGLLGSTYYTQNPIVPLENTIVDLNVDMVGRIDPEREGDRNYIYLIGSDKLSMELHNLSEQVNTACCNIELDYTYNDESDPNRYYYRSDHYNFAKNNIPVIFYFNGVHANYHKSTDTVKKINFDLLANRAKLIFYTTWEVANRKNRVVADKL